VAPVRHRRLTVVDGLFGLAEAACREHPDRESYGAAGGKVGEDLGDHGGKFVKMPRAWRGQRNLRMVEVHVHNEMLVGRDRLHADVGGEALARQRRNVRVPRYSRTNSVSPSRTRRRKIKAGIRRFSEVNASGHRFQASKKDPKSVASTDRARRPVARCAIEPGRKAQVAKRARSKPAAYLHTGVKTFWTSSSTVSLSPSRRMPVQHPRH
jgi:hypothetical protein